MQYTHVAPIDKLASRLRRHLEAAAKHFPPALIAGRPHLAEALARFHGEMIDAAVATLEALDVVPAEDAADAMSAARMNELAAELLASIPPISGGAPDDFEEVSAEFLADHDGPTPLEVLALDDPAREPSDAWEPSDADWDEMFRMSDASLTEADHMVVHGCV